MDIADIRKSLGKTAEGMSDEQVQDTERRLRVLANIVIDRVLEMTQKERVSLDKKIKAEKIQTKKKK